MEKKKIISYGVVVLGIIGILVVMVFAQREGEPEDVKLIRELSKGKLKVEKVRIICENSFYVGENENCMVTEIDELDCNRYSTLCFFNIFDGFWWGDINYANSEGFTIGRCDKSFPNNCIYLASDFEFYKI